MKSDLRVVRTDSYLNIKLIAGKKTQSFGYGQVVLRGRSSHSGHVLRRSNDSEH